MKQVLVCCGTSCLASGSMAVLTALREKANTLSVDIQPRFKATGCNGFCENGPIVKILLEDGSDISYYRVRLSDVDEIVSETLRHGRVIPRLCFTGSDGNKVTEQRENPFYARQVKNALRNIGLIDPLDIMDYESRGGYTALRNALARGGEWILSEVEVSGLRGRGGAASLPRQSGALGQHRNGK